MKFNATKIRLIEYFPAIVTGFLLTASFPKGNFSFCAWIGLVPLMVSVRKMNRTRAFYAGLTAGMAFFLSLLYWIVPTLDIYGKLPFLLSVPILVLLAFYLGLYTGIFALGLKFIGDDSVIMPFQAAALWVGLEYLRSFLFTGFPWGIIGYSQYMNIHIIQIADVTGVYGVSFLVVAANGVFSVMWTTLTTSGVFVKTMECDSISEMPARILPVPAFEIKKAVTSFFCFICIMGLVLYYGFSRLDMIRGMDKKADTVKIAVIQGNINQAVKWERRFKIFSAEKYCGLSELASRSDPDLIVWPETAMPFYYPIENVPSVIVDKCIRKIHTCFIIGSPAFRRDKKGRPEFFNRAYMINKNAVITGEYDKVHLVPFGEYVPFGKYLAFLGKLTAQAGDFSAGKGKLTPLRFNNKKAGVLICFEIIFPDLAREFVRNGADILVTITNDAWFGTTSAPFQHFSMSVFRAVENRRSVARAANTGISGFIFPTGKIFMESPLDKDMFLSAKLFCLKMKTYYTCFGDWFAIICLIAIPFIFMIDRKECTS